MLVHRQSRPLLEPCSSPTDAREEAMLGIAIGESPAQGAVEALREGPRSTCGGQEAQRRGAAGSVSLRLRGAPDMARKLANASPASIFVDPHWP